MPMTPDEAGMGIAPQAWEMGTWWACDELRTAGAGWSILRGGLSDEGPGDEYLCGEGVGHDRGCGARGGEKVRNSVEHGALR